MTNDAPAEWLPDRPPIDADEVAADFLEEARETVDAVDKVAAAAEASEDIPTHHLAEEAREAVERLAEHLASQEHRQVTIVGHPQERRLPPEGADCRVEGCGAPAGRFAVTGSGEEIPVCRRCGEELDAILA